MLRLISPRRLKQKGIVGMNMRNVRYVAGNNPRHLYPLVDDKLKTKMLAEQAGLAVPKLIGVMRVQKHVKQLVPFMEGHNSFVIKPAKGSGGKGIMVVTGRDGDGFIRPDGKVITEADLHRHASNILSGLYSLGGNPDVAMIEEKIEFSEIFDEFTYQGVPDLRIIVYKGYPVMSMARLSTSNSGGKANLHQGAVGAGIDVGSGKALHAIQHGLPVENHPDTGRRLVDLAIPRWKECLTQASKCFEVTGLGYLGADIVLDANKGPLILELNARPGLAIQVANGQGLQLRLDLVDSVASTPRPVVERVAFSIKHFGRLP
ncbi:alpha-L-glutamate ligase-like protein [Oleidesulfovibrio sp.]|uniref:alpha-L-glutamate ligase-like protein n=1 Tax=Oleidesulfovibrio sp. TaxID=2909707 RepID=UPI003A878EB2